MDLRNSSLLITGGTGSFGLAMVEKMLPVVKRVVVFSRDEKKQYDIKRRHKDVECILGDIRDYDSILKATRTIDYVFHAAALKHVPNYERHPTEAIKTNVIGSTNVFEACARNGIKRCVALSTDKACYPINVMGQTKALMEKIAYNYPNVVVTRYGNVAGSRGSVIPLFRDQIKKFKTVSITHKNMTRFLMSMDEATDLVFKALISDEPDDFMFIRKAKAAKITDLANALAGGIGIKFVISGIRPGEKMHEVLVTGEERERGQNLPKFYRIPREIPEGLNQNLNDYSSEKNLMSNFELQEFINSYEQ